MATIDNIITVDLQVQSSNPTRAGFGIPLIVDDLPAGPLAAFGADIIREYTSLAAMLDDDFATTDLAYLKATALQAQSPRVRKWKIGSRATPVAQITTITVATVTNDAVYSGTVNGTAFTYTADGSATDVEISAGVKSAIDALSLTAVFTTTNPTATTVVLTAAVAGVPFTCTSDHARLTVATGTASVGVEDDLSDIAEVDNEWYAVIVTERNDYVLKRAAVWVSTRTKVLLAQSATAGILTSGTTDIAYVVEALAYDNVFLFYHSDADEALDAAAAGLMLPYDPGSATMHGKEFTGITSDTLTDSQFGYARGKTCNLYVDVGTAGWCFDGKASDGTYWDIRIGLDAMEVDIQDAGADLIRNNAKVPYTKRGIAMVEAALRGVLEKYRTQGLLADGYTVTVPDIADVSAADKTARTLNNVEFAGTFQGAIHSIDFTGSLSY